MADDLERNDVDGAIAAFRRKVYDGTWRPEMIQVLLMLQDDPSELERRIAEEVDRDAELRQRRAELEELEALRRDTL